MLLVVPTDLQVIQNYNFRIPTENNPNRRKLWLNAIRRENWPDNLIRNARICSAHFISGMYIFIYLLVLMTTSIHIN